MGYSHSHAHDGHRHTHHANKRSLLIGFLFISTFMIVEFIGGILTDSLALISDAGHMLSDAAALGLSLLAFKIGEKGASASKTFGYKRFEILAAFLNGMILVGISLFIFWEAYRRFQSPPEVLSKGMMIVAIIGLLINIFVAWILMKGDTSENLNLRSAFLHVIGDLFGSVGAIIAALLIMFFNWNIADPIASGIVAILILISGWRVLKDSVHVLMEGNPTHINLAAVKEKLSLLPGVKDIHDLHIWSITSDFPSLSCHLVVNNTMDRDVILEQASELLCKEFNIHHTTIQIEGETSSLFKGENHCN